MEQLLLEHKRTYLSKEKQEERNTEILHLWREEHLCYSEIGTIVGLSKNQVGKILRDNFHITPRNRSWEKEKRINATWREFKAKENEPSKKDKIEILEQLRKEFESEEKISSINFNKIEIIVVNEDPTQEQRRDNTDDCIDVEASSMLQK